jgi:methyl-accepting chemotaxis protein
MTNANTVTALLQSEGFGPRMGFGGFAAAVWLAEAVSQTIQRPIRRAQFVADAAAELARLDYQPFDGLADEAASLAETAEEARATPCGSVELWGSLLQKVEPA